MIFHQTPLAVLQMNWDISSVGLPYVPPVKNAGFLHCTFSLGLYTPWRRASAYRYGLILKTCPRKKKILDLAWPGLQLVECVLLWAYFFSKCHFRNTLMVIVISVMSAMSAMSVMTVKSYSGCFGLFWTILACCTILSILGNFVAIFAMMSWWWTDDWQMIWRWSDNEVMMNWWWT